MHQRLGQVSAGVIGRERELAALQEFLVPDARAPIDPAWLDDELGELEHMVGRGETLDVVSKLATMMREPRRVGSAVLEDTLH